MTIFTSAVELAAALVQRDSSNSPGTEESCAFLLQNLLAENGFDVSLSRMSPGRVGLVARLAGRPGPALCFTGHLDTVPFGAEAWTVPPLSGRIENGRLYGRGASDMKSGVAAAAWAALELARRPDRPSLVLVFTCGEETGCQGARYMADVGELPDDVGAMIVAEPTSNVPLLGHKGALWLRAGFAGKSAHGSMPEEGESAILKLAGAVDAVSRMYADHPGHPDFGPPTINVGRVGGGSQINMVPDRAWCEIDIRSVAGMEHARMLQEVRDILGEGSELKVLSDLPCVYTAGTDPFYVSAVREYARKREEPEAARTVSYFTDASVLWEHFGRPATVIMGPGEATQAHKTDEYCSVANIEEAVGMYLELASGWGVRESE